MRILRVRSKKQGESVVVTLSGELDVSTAGQVEQTLSRVERRAPQVLVLDLRELEFIDSTGLRVVLAADARARRQGRRLALVEGPPTVHRVFRIALLDRRLEFVPDPGAIDGEDGS